MGLNRNINDDSTLAYLFNKTRQGASDALGKAIEKINDALTVINNTIASIQTALNNKVSKSGDTMTGALTINTNEVGLKDTSWDKTVAPQATYSSPSAVVFRDENGEEVGSIYSYANTDGSYGIRFRAYNGTTDNGLGIRIDSSGNKLIGVSNPEAWLTAIRAVGKAGDTMTGSLGITRGNAVTSIDLIASADDITVAPSSVVNNNSVFFKDKNGKYYGMLRSRHLTDGKYGLWIAGLKSDGSSGNGVELLFDQEGNRSVTIGYPAGWRSALGLGSIATVTSPVPIANGGTGQTEVTSSTTVSQVATAASGVSITSVHYAQWGKLAQVNINVKATSAYASGNLLCTLVSGKRPVNTLTIMDNNGYHTTFNTNGQVNVWHAYAANATFSVRCVYLLA